MAKKKVNTAPAGRGCAAAGTRNPMKSNDQRRAEHCNAALTPRNWRFPLPAGVRRPRTRYRILRRIRYPPPTEELAGETPRSASSRCERVDEVKVEEEYDHAPVTDDAAATHSCANLAAPSPLWLPEPSAMWLPENEFQIPGPAPELDFDLCDHTFLAYFLGDLPEC